MGGDRSASTSAVRFEVVAWSVAGMATGRCMLPHLEALGYWHVHGEPHRVERHVARNTVGRPLVEAEALLRPKSDVLELKTSHQESAESEHANDLRLQQPAVENGGRELVRGEEIVRVVAHAAQPGDEHRVNQLLNRPSDGSEHGKAAVLPGTNGTRRHSACAHDDSKWARPGVACLTLSSALRNGTSVSPVASPKGSKPLLPTKAALIKLPWAPKSECLPCNERQSLITLGSPTRCSAARAQFPVLPTKDASRWTAPC